MSNLRSSVALRVLLAFCLLLVFAGCDEAEVQTGPSNTGVASVRVVDGPASLRVTAFDPDGQVVAGPRSGAREVELLDVPLGATSLQIEALEQGLVRSLQVQELTLIDGQPLDVQATALVPVQQALESVEVEPAQLTLARGTQEQVRAVGRYRDGTAADFTGLVNWTADSGLGLSPQGVVNAAAGGAAQVHASYGGLRATGQVTVSEASVSSLQVEEGEDDEGFRLVGFFSDGSQQELTEQATFSVNQAQGEVTASFQGQQAVAPIRAQTPRTLSRITISPTSASVVQGSTVALRATGVWTDGTTSNLTTTAAWTSSSAVATVSQGSVRGVRAGSATLRATYAGKTASAVVTVTAPTLSSLTITSAGSLPVGTTKNLTVTARYSNNTTANVTQSATFRSSAGTVASVSTLSPTKGQVKALKVGQSSLSAAFGGKSVATTVTVVAPTLSRITVDPSTVSLPLGLTQPLNVTAIFSDGSARSVTSSASFTSSASNVASVSTLTSRGVVTARARGTATITATYLGMSAQSRISVVDARLTSLRFEPASASLPLGATHKFLVRGLYSDGSQRDLTSVAALSVGHPQLLALTSAPGEVRGVGQGSTTVTAAYGGRSSTAAVSITAAVLNRLDVAPANTSFPAGTTQQFQAIGLFSDGSTRDLTSSASWTAGDSTVLELEGGRGRGLRTGTSSVSASYQGFTGRATAQVSSAVVTGLTLDPATAQLPNGLTLSLKATALYSDGTSRDVTEETTFVSSDSTVATVSTSEPRGVVRGLGVGTASVRADFAGQTARTALTVTGAVVNELRLEPSAVQVAAGTSHTFVVRALMSDGSQLDVTSQAALEVEEPSVASPTGAAGQVRGDTPGSSGLTATYLGKTARATLTVGPALLTSLEVSPSSSSIPVGLSQQLIATGIFSDGNRQDLTDSVNWSAADPAIVEVDAAGAARGLAVGSTRVTAMLLDTQAECQVVVSSAVVSRLTLSSATTTLPKGLTQPLTATAHYTDGSDREVTSQAAFDSSDRAVAVVSNAEPRGIVSALQPGSFTATASFEGKSASLDLAVSGAVLTGLRVTPASLRLIEGTSAGLLVEALFSDGMANDVTAEAALSLEDEAVTTFTGIPGEVQGLAPGQTQLTAAFQGQSAQASLTVVQAQVVSLAVEPETVSLPAGDTRNLTARARMDNGRAEDLTSAVGWRVENSSVAAVDESGKLTALASGETEVIASIGGVEARRAVTVTAAVLRSITLTPDSLSLPEGLSHGLVAEGFMSDGTRVALTSGLTWTVEDSDVASVDEQGLVRALQTGQTVVKASAAGGIAGQASLTVTPAQLRSLRLAPGGAQSLPKGAQLSLQALAGYSDGSEVDVTAQALWSSSEDVVASVDQGRVETLSQGTTRIVCELEDQEATLDLEVTSAALASIEVSAGTATLPRGLATSARAVGIYTDNTRIDLSEVSWTSSNDEVAWVSSVGKVSALGQGTAVITAEKDGVKGSLTLGVSNVALQEMSFSPTYLSPLNAGLSATLAVSGRFSDGSTLDMADQVSWSTLHPAVASVTNAGVVTGKTAGVTRVRVIAPNGISREMLVTVKAARALSVRILPPPGPAPVGVYVPFLAEIAYSDGSVKTTNAVSWHCESGSLASFGSTFWSTQLLTKAPGTANITASWSASGDPTITARATYVIESIPLEQLVVSPANAELPYYEKTNYVATGVYANGASYDLGHAVAWAYTAGSGSGVSIARNGTTKGQLSSGGVDATGTVTASLSNGPSTSVPLSVAGSATITSLALSPTSAVMAAGTSLKLLATATYSNGFQSTVVGSLLSSDSTILSGISDGTMVAKRPGTATFKMTYRGVSAEIPVVVTDANLTSLQITPRSLTVPVGLKSDLVCKGTYSDAVVREVTPEVEWSSEDTRIATVDQDGRLTTREEGVVTITARDPRTGLEALLNVNVVRKTLRSLSFDKGPTLLKVNTDRAFKIEGLYSDNSVYDLSQTVAWESSAPAVATVGNLPNDKGRLKGLATGSTTLSVLEPVSGLTASDTVELTSSNRTRVWTSVADNALMLQRSPDGQRLYLLTKTGLDTYSADSLALLDHLALTYGGGIDVSPDGAYVVVTHRDRNVLTLVKQDDYSTSTIPLPSGETSRGVTWADNGYLYALLKDKIAAINVSTRQLTYASHPYGRETTYCRFIRYDALTGKLVAAGGESGGDIYRFSANGPTVVYEVEDSSGGGNGQSLKMDPRGGRFVFAAGTGNYSKEHGSYIMLLWNLLDYDLPFSGMDSGTFPTDAAFAPNASVMYGINFDPYDKRIYILDPDTGRELGHLDGEIGGLDMRKLEISPDGSELYLCTSGSGRLSAIPLRPR